MVPWSIAALFLVLTIAFLHGAVFTSKLPVPVDDVMRGDPWHRVVGDVIPRNAITNDTVRLFLPWMQAAREELLHCRAPLWNRYSFSGYPLLANSQSAPLSPLFLATLFVPLPKQIVAMAGLKIFFSLLFTYLLLQREKVSTSASIFGAIVFAFSVFETVYLYYSVTAVTALLPAALFAVLHALDDPRKKNVVFVAIVVATLLANGHPESVLHVAIACAALLLVELAFSSDRRGWLQRVRAPLAGVFAGLALSAPAWVPVLEQVRLSKRYAEVHAGHGFAPIPVTALWAVVTPNGFGNPLRHNFAWFVNYPGVAISYLGLLPLALFIAAAVAPRTPARDRTVIVLSVLLFLAAMNWSIVGHAINAIPPFSITANEKLRFVSVFLVAMVAAKALDQPKVLIAVAGLPLIALVGFVFRKHATVMRPVDAVGIASVVIFLFLPQRFAAIAIAAELFALNAGFNALVDGRYFRPPLPIVSALRSHAPLEPFRIVGRDWVFLPNASAQYGLEDIRGSDPMVSASYDQYLRRFTVEEEGTDVRRVVDVDRQELDFLNVRFLLAEPGATFGDRWRLLYHGPDGSLFENVRAMPRFFGRDGAQVLEIENPDATHFRLKVVSVASSIVASSQPAHGWRVQINGRQTSALGGAFLSFPVPGGTSTVDVVYRPASFYVAIAVAFLVLIALIAAHPHSMPRLNSPLLPRQAAPG